MSHTTDTIKTYIKARLSLRQPQSDSLDFLHHIVNDVDLETIPMSELLEKVKTIAKHFSDFDFAFPSLCFALATGVGKTRLMGAMIYYLYKTRGIRNFFVVAPNLTIYNKLIQDFSYWSKKYVFKGLSDIDGQNPLIIHGDNYADINHVINNGLDLINFKFSINIFNISKFNSKKETTKLKSFSEYIGESYFEYLQNLKDLVVLMDESHRYRASSSMDAINNLKPLLGLEFTATPFVQKWTKKDEFDNVLYHYNLANAIRDGFVKVPWVAIRENTDTTQMSKEQIDFLKITDGIAVHERTKTELRLYADNYDKPYVKPFLMISAENQNHADQIEQLIKTQLYSGRYADKTIKIYSGQSGAEEEEAIAKLLEVEKSENPVEIVIQVMMLKEWRDVNNLYTIVPLRASTALILTEQTIGRWLRLPYGERVWIDEIDRLTIIAHDRYQEVINEAKKDGSLIRNVINLDSPDAVNFTAKMETIKTTPIFLKTEYSVQSSRITQQLLKSETLTHEEWNIMHNLINTTVSDYLNLQSSQITTDTPEIQQQKMMSYLFAQVANSQDESIKQVFGKIGEQKTTNLLQERTQEIFRDWATYVIEIPRVSFYRPDPQPRFDTNYRIHTGFLQGLLSPESAIRIQNLTNQDIERIKATQQIAFKWTVRDYFVHLMMEISELDYDSYSHWMYEMATDMTEILVETLWTKTDDEYKLHVHLYKDYITNEIKKQLLKPWVYTITIAPGEVRVALGMTRLRGATYSYIPSWSFDFRETSFDKQKIKSYIFGWFTKTADDFVKFDSDAERRLSVILEQDEKVIKRVKPKEWTITIDYYFENKRYEYRPDFIVETENNVYILEPKASNEVADPKVLAKKQYTEEWIQAVNTHANSKKRSYCLIADSNIKETYAFDYVVSLKS